MFDIEHSACAKSGGGPLGKVQEFLFDAREFRTLTPDQSLARALDEHVVLAPHDPRWAAAFAAERDRLLAGVAGRILEIRHFGSTAVQGLSAKPVIDLIAGVASIAQADELIPALCELGYHHPAQRSAGLADRRWLFRHRDGHRTHQLHLVEHDGPAWRDRVRFCELLKADPGLRGRYDRLKRELAARFAEDRDAYNAHKQAFVLSAVNQASGLERFLPCLPYPLA